MEHRQPRGMIKMMSKSPHISKQHQTRVMYLGSSHGVISESMWPMLVTRCPNDAKNSSGALEAPIRAQDRIASTG